MKVTNWRRKLMASLVAGGLMSPVSASAANLDTNLVINPGFETVDINSSQGGYNAVQILNWTDGSNVGFAYSHNDSLNGAGEVIPDYANGGPLAGGGNFYFTSNATPGDLNVPGEFAQNIDVSTGPTGNLIPSGEAAVKLRGSFSGYSTNGDYGHLHVEFLDLGGGSLGTTEITNENETDTWRQKSGFALVPAGAASLRVSLFGTPLSGGPDGYIDNVDVQVTAAANELLFLEVNTTNGQTRVRNQTGETVNIDYYEITSAGNALNATAWNSLQEQDLAEFPAGDGSGNGWEEAGGSSSSIVSESYLTGNSAVANESTIGLGAAFNVGGAQDLVFEYGALAASSGNPTGDYNDDGTVNAADYVAWRKGGPLANDPTPGVQPEDYDVWRENFGLTGAPSGPGTLTTGFVRYVTSFSAAGVGSVVPEPSTVILVGVGLCALVVGGRRRTS